MRTDRTIWLAAVLATGVSMPLAAERAQRAAMTQDARAHVVRKRPFPEYRTWWPLGKEFSTSYAFFRSAFELIQRHRDRYGSPVETERRLLTRRVGKRFFSSVHGHLGLTLPARLDDDASVAKLKASIGTVIAFLTGQRYFRDRAAFRFDVDAPRKGGRIVQPERTVADRLRRDGHAYALFEMSYPVILPSAVYLFQTVGEAQHHSSRTIEELFDRVGYEASETPDFDPSGYPSDLVVELWQIRKR